jgi:UDP-N-acetylenolpyruvoylglucosamine reductase
VVENRKFLSPKDLKGTDLITAGPSQEPMSCAVHHHRSSERWDVSKDSQAEEVQTSFGSGSNLFFSQKDIKWVPVRSAEEMKSSFDHVEDVLLWSGCGISDYRPRWSARRK